ncbi:MAG: AsmA family protein [Gammaproteobacteria bacterium]|nr:AsmA family protein [Gammaproteobacteria bacterium]
MRKLLKWLAWIFLSLVILMVIAGVVIAKFINPNDYKPQIIAAVNKATGRNLSLPGNLSWTFFPNLGIHIGQASLSNPAGYGQPIFAEVQSADVSIAVLPLLSGQLQANTLDLQGLQLNLERKTMQDNNWTFAAKASQEVSYTSNSAGSASAASQMAFVPVISNLVINNANVNYIDDTTGARYALANVNFTGKHISLDAPFGIKLSFTAQSNQPQLTANIALQAKLYANLSNQVYRLDSIDAQANIIMPRQGAKPMQLNANISGSAMIDLNQGILTATPAIVLNKQLALSAKLNVTQLLDNINYSGQVQVKPFDLDELLQSLGLNVPRFPNSQALSNASLQGQFSGNKNSLSISKLLFTLNKSTVQGQFSIANFSAPTISTQLSMDQVDLSDYVNLKGAGLPIQNINLQAQLNSKGWAKSVFPSTLNGQLSLGIQQITLKGLDLNETFNSLNSSITDAGDGGNFQAQITSIQNEFSSSNSKQFINANNGKQTPFGNAIFQGQIQNGVLKSTQLSLNGPTIQVKGSGQANLNKQHMNFLFYITHSGTRSEPSFTLPYRVSGSFSDPQQGIDWVLFQVELQKYLAQALQQGVQNAVKGSVNNLLNQLVNSVGN